MVFLCFGRKKKKDAKTFGVEDDAMSAPEARWATPLPSNFDDAKTFVGSNTYADDRITIAKILDVAVRWPRLITDEDVGTVVKSAYDNKDVESKVIMRCKIAKSHAGDEDALQALHALINQPLRRNRMLEGTHARLLYVDQSVQTIIQDATDALCIELNTSLRDPSNKEVLLLLLEILVDVCGMCCSFIPTLKKLDSHAMETLRECNEHSARRLLYIVANV